MFYQVPAALSAQNGGADGISAINTIKSVSHIDLNASCALPNIKGHSSISGFSGKAGRPVGLRFVAELCKADKLTIPISGMGGIYTWHDAAEYLALGASNLQATSSVMQYGVGIVDDMQDGLRRHLVSKGYQSVEELIGTARSSLVDPSCLDMTTEVASHIDENKCIGCGACVIACRDGSTEAITLSHPNLNTEKRTAHVDWNKCIGCELCKFVCPVDAIKFYVRERVVRA